MKKINSKLLAGFLSVVLALSGIGMLQIPVIAAVGDFSFEQTNDIEEDAIRVTDEMIQKASVFVAQAAAEARRLGHPVVFLAPGHLSPDSVSSYKNLDLTQLMQTDPAWENIPLNGSTSGNTIGTAGCGITSYAMILNYLFGVSSHTPATVNTTLGSAAASVSNSWGGYYNLTCTQYYPDSTSVADEKAFLTVLADLIHNEDKPLMVSIRKSTGGMHYVAAQGYSIDYSGNVNLLIRDTLTRSGVNIPSLNSYLFTNTYGNWELSSARLFK